MNTSDRAKLRSIAMTEKAITQVGKNGVTDTVLKQVDEQLTARELVKVALRFLSRATDRQSLDLHAVRASQCRFPDRCECVAAYKARNEYALVVVDVGFHPPSPPRPPQACG